MQWGAFDGTPLSHQETKKLPRMRGCVNAAKKPIGFAADPYCSFSLVLRMKIRYNSPLPFSGHDRERQGGLGAAERDAMATSSEVAQRAEAATLAAGAPARSLRDVLGDRWELHDAWRRMKRSTGQPGPDRVTVEAFETHLDRHLAELAVSVATGQYRAGPISRQFLGKKDAASE